MELGLTVSCCLSQSSAWIAEHYKENVEKVSYCAHEEQQGHGHQETQLLEGGHFGGATPSATPLSRSQSIVLLLLYLFRKPLKVERLNDSMTPWRTLELNKRA